MHDKSTKSVVTLSHGATQKKRAPQVGLRGRRGQHYTAAELLEARIVREPYGCWNVLGYLLPRHGYPQIRANGKVWAAYRLAWTLANGPIPKGQVVAHRCDNPRCANPDHLFLATQAENIHDSITKGRFTAHHRDGVRLDGRRSRRREHASVFVRVPSRQLPIRGVLHLSESDTLNHSRGLNVVQAVR